MDDPPRRVAVVGNAPPEADHGREIDAADAVWRINKAPGLDGARGRLVDRLFLVNCGGQMREWLGDPGFAHRDPVARAALVVLAIDPATTPAHELASEDGRDWTPEAARHLGDAGRPVCLLPGHAFRASVDALARLSTRARFAPSTGYLALREAVLAWRPDDPPVEAWGFGFEGWEGHDFAAERHWAEGEVAAGRLRLRGP
ncbi:MAG: hypothetical protein ACFBWO_06325 [Paracoccaceae bacterium]